MIETHISEHTFVFNNIVETELRHSSESSSKLNDKHIIMFEGEILPIHMERESGYRNPIEKLSFNKVSGGSRAREEGRTESETE